MSVKKHTAFFTGLAFLIIAIAFCLPGFAGLTKDAITLIGIFIASLILWIFVAIDWPSLITILALGLIPALGFNNTFKEAFGNSTVAFLLFTFALVYPLSKTALIKRCTVFFITNCFARKGPWFFTAFVLLAATFMGLFISPSVLFVAFLPFLKDIIAFLGLKEDSPAATMLMTGTAICINLSSGMTPISHVWPTMAIGYYEAATGLTIDHFRYMLFGIPCGFLIIAILFLTYRFIKKPADMQTIKPDKALELKKDLTPISRKEKIILITLALTVALWILPGLLSDLWPNFYRTINSYTSAFPPLLGCIILFVIKCDGERILDFKEVTSKGIMWGSIIMTAAATVLGSAITNENIGISVWLSEHLGSLSSQLPAFGMVAVFLLWALIETNFSSNIVTTTVVSSVALTVTSLLPQGTISIPALIMLIGFAAAVCNMTPAGQSTVNTVAIASGYTDTRKMFTWGLWTAIVAFGILLLIGYPLAAWLMK